MLGAAVEVDIHLREQMVIVLDGSYHLRDLDLMADEEPFGSVDENH
jgi:hypothetical protein